MGWLRAKLRLGAVRLRVVQQGRLLCGFERTAGKRQTAETAD